MLKKATKRPLKVEALAWNGGECAQIRNTEYKSGEKIAGQEFSPRLENTTCSVSKASRRSRRKKRRWNIRSKGRMDAKSRWSVAEILATDCEKHGLTQDEKMLCRNGTSG